MLALRCFLSSRASQRGRLLRWGGRSAGVSPCLTRGGVRVAAERRGRGGGGEEAEAEEGKGEGAHSEEVNALEALTRQHSHKLHLAEKGNLGRHQTWRERQCHGAQ